MGHTSYDLGLKRKRYQALTQLGFPALVASEFCASAGIFSGLLNAVGVDTAAYDSLARGKRRGFALDEARMARERLAFEVNRRRMQRGKEPLQMARIMRAARFVRGESRRERAA